jgi:hypothetical protein
MYREKRFFSSHVWSLKVQNEWEGPIDLASGRGLLDISIMVDGIMAGVRVRGREHMLRGDAREWRGISLALL